MGLLAFLAAAYLAKPLLTMQMITTLLKIRSHQRQHPMHQTCTGRLPPPRLIPTRIANRRTEPITPRHTSLLTTLQYMTAHPTQLRPNTPHIPIQHRPLPTHHHNPHIPILHTPLAATPLRRLFWQSLLHRLRKFTQPKISHNGVLYQTRWAQQVKHGSNGRQPWQEILSLKIATALMH
jgi:hypothetical protein